ncbi:MAG: hypothetical protein ISS28_03910 [Candidatus Cloacimonetes bacterium]|nr:hypothetical protein [Candidatus Cloacimonadota bacterium]MBL7086231.1 hypothetical protein [Candidatus Cloacimonadota bacterium]
MIESFQYKFELHKLRKVQRKLAQEYEVAEVRVKKKGFNDWELSSIAQKEDEFDKWIDYRQTQYFQRLCQRLLVPMPDIENEKLYYKFNFDDEHGDRHILTTVGFHAVRNLIREEKKRKRAAFGFWFTVLIGLIGALIGLVSVLNK